MQGRAPRAPAARGSKGCQRRQPLASKKINGLWLAWVSLAWPLRRRGRAPGAAEDARAGGDCPATRQTPPPGATGKNSLNQTPLKMLVPVTKTSFGPGFYIVLHGIVKIRFIVGSSSSSFLNIKYYIMTSSRQHIEKNRWCWKHGTVKNIVPCWSFNSNYCTLQFKNHNLLSLINGWIPKLNFLWCRFDSKQAFASHLQL